MHPDQRRMPLGVRQAVAVAGEPTEEHLDVYESRNGWWNPDHGDIDIPPGWEPSPAATRFSLDASRPPARTGWHGRRHPNPSPPACHRRARAQTAIDEARTVAQATATRRAADRNASAKQRDRQEATYRSELAVAIVAYLDFAPRHAQLANEIAERAATRAGEVGSGRVGRTRLLTLDERAELAARADIRHHHTTYEDNLAEYPAFPPLCDGAANGNTCHAMTARDHV